MFRSATFTLTIWYVLLATCLSLLFSLVVYHLSTDEISEALNRQYASLTNSENYRDSDSLPPPDPEIQRHAQHLLGELLWFNAIVIVGSSVGGYFLARRTLRPIEDAHKAQVRFTAEASHELRTPLAAMRADTEVALMEKGLSTKARNTLRGNLRDIERLEGLTNYLLDIARYKNKATATVVPVNMDQVVQNAIKQTSYAAHKKQIKIEQHIKPVQVAGEERALSQLVSIVLDNAIKYSHEQSKIIISLLAKDEVTLTIQDNGIGIPAADIPHLFAPFYRASNTQISKETSDGYGLGLPLAYEIAETYGGNISVHSEEGVGTTVTIKLRNIHS